MIEGGLAEMIDSERFRPKARMLQLRWQQAASARQGDTNVFIGHNVAAMGPGATANRTTYQLTSGGPAMAQVGGDEQQLGAELLQLVTALAGKDREAFIAATDALSAHNKGDEKGLLSALRNIPEKVITGLELPILLEILKNKLHVGG